MRSKITLLLLFCCSLAFSQAQADSTITPDFQAGDEKANIKEGSILFVKAEVPHRFYEIEEDLQVLVFFAAAVKK